MEASKVAVLGVPLLLVVGTAAYLLFLRKPKKLTDAIFSLNTRRLRIYLGSEPPACSVLVIENDDKLSCSNAIAKSVAAAAGDSLRRQCDRWIEKYGNPLPGEKVSTDGGRLHIKKIFHVVPSEEMDVQFLRDLFREKLREAGTSSSRVAMSMVGLSGGYSLEEYSRMLADECKAVLSDQTLKLEDLTLWCTEEAHFIAISQAFK